MQFCVVDTSAILPSFLQKTSGNDTHMQCQWMITPASDGLAIFIIMFYYFFDVFTVRVTATAQ